MSKWRLIASLLLATLVPAITGQATMTMVSGARVTVTTPPGEYDWIDNPVGYTDHWVDPEKTTNGASDCPEVDPCQWSQMMAFDPDGERHRFILLAGEFEVTAVATGGGSKMPAIQPQHSGTQANPVLVTASCPATRSSCTSEQHTVIRRTANAGSIFGTFNSADYWRVDGVKFAGTHGGAGAENAHIVLRNTQGWWFTRFVIDDEHESYVPNIPCEEPPQPGCNNGSTNGGGIFMQLVSDIVLRDFIIENLGSTDPENLDVWQGVEMYDATDVDVSYFTLREIWGFGLHMKGAPEVPFQRNRIHHGLVDTCEDTGFSPLDVAAGEDPANHNYWWNIIVIDCTRGITFNSIGPHRGTHIQNVTVVGSNEGIKINRAGDTVDYAGDVSIRNSVIYSNATAVIWVDGSFDDDVDMDYNRYNTFPSRFMNSSAGNWTFSTWQANSEKDANSDDDAPVFVNSGAGNYLTDPGVAADRPDTHDLYDEAMVPPGAWEDVGARTNL